MMVELRDFASERESEPRTGTVARTMRTLRPVTRETIKSATE